MKKTKNTLGIQYENFTDLEKYRFRQYLETTNKLKFRQFTDRVQYDETPEITVEVGFHHAINYAKMKVELPVKTVAYIRHTGRDFQTVKTNTGESITVNLQFSKPYEVGQEIR